MQSSSYGLRPTGQPAGPGVVKNRTRRNRIENTKLSAQTWLAFQLGPLWCPIRHPGVNSNVLGAKVTFGSGGLGGSSGPSAGFNGNGQRMAKCYGESNCWRRMGEPSLINDRKPHATTSTERHLMSMRKSLLAPLWAPPTPWPAHGLCDAHEG